MKTLWFQFGRNISSLASKFQDIKVESGPPPSFPHSRPLKHRHFTSQTGHPGPWANISVSSVALAAAVPRGEPVLYLEKDSRDPFSQQIRPQPLQRPLPDGPVVWLSLEVCQFEIPGQDWPILVPRIWQTRRAQLWQRSEIICCDLTSFFLQNFLKILFFY